MTGASDTLDPIAAAEAGIVGSKHLIASVANDLSQQERWLAHYRVAEKRRARRVKIQEIIYWLELRRRRVMRWSRRQALNCMRLARTAAAFLWRNAVALFNILSRTAASCLAWLRPRAYALALLLAAWTIAFLAWTATEARLLARTLANAAAIAAAWTVHQSRVLGAMLRTWSLAAWAWTRVGATRLARVSIKGASIGATWSAARSRSLATSLRRESTKLASWTRRKAGHFSRASLATASLGFSWAKPTGQHADANHHTLAIKRCTALICIEPPRACLPAIRAELNAQQSVSSDAGRAFP